MLVRINNANALRRESVSMPYSKMKASIAKILKDQGYILSFLSEGEGAKKTLIINLKYGENGERVITGMKRSNAAFADMSCCSTAEKRNMVSV